MQYEIQGAPYPVAIINMNSGESVLCQSGAMVWMSPNMKMETKAGGFGKAFSRLVSGESLFQNTYTAEGGPGMIAFSSTLPGDVLAIDLKPGQSIVAQKRAFLASAPTVSYEIFFQKKLGAGFFGGEGFIMQKFTGSGMLLLEIDGSTITYDLAPGQSMLIDTGNLAACDATCSIDIESVPGVKNALLGGEGLFNTRVTGPGKVWLQTMPISGMASALAAYLPNKG